MLGDQVLPIVEIHPLDGFYDYTNKYTKGRTEYFCPARLPQDITGVIQKHALKAHRAIGNAVYSRIDFLLEKETNSRFDCLEVNTIPGMTATSLLPKEGQPCRGEHHFPPALPPHRPELSWAAQPA